MISRKTLIPMLVANGYIPEDGSRVGYETFGRKTFAYVYVETMEKRRRLETFLSDAGMNVNRSYYPGKPVVEVQISYFKAHGWDE